MYNPFFIAWRICIAVTNGGSEGSGEYAECGVKVAHTCFFTTCS
jgi:hypothetical protein